MLLLDDHLLFAQAVEAILEDAGMEVVATLSDPAAAEAALDPLAPDVVLVDLGLPGSSGIEVGERMMARRPGLKLVAVTASTEPSDAEATLQAGFHGFLTKDTEAPRFVSALRLVLDGQAVFPRRLVAKAPAGTAQEREAALLAGQLTEREREVLAQLVEGADGDEIARRLSISRNTVRTHIQNVLAKLGVHSRLEAAAFAVRHGVVKARRAR